MIEWSQTYGCWGQPCMAKTRECCGALSLRRTGDDLHVSLHKGFKIRLAGIVPVFIELTGSLLLQSWNSQNSPEKSRYPILIRPLKYSRASMSPLLTCDIQTFCCKLKEKSHHATTPFMVFCCTRWPRTNPRTITEIKWRHLSFMDGCSRIRRMMQDQTYLILTCYGLFRS